VHFAGLSSTDYRFQPINGLPGLFHAPRFQPIGASDRIPHPGWFGRDQRRGVGLPFACRSTLANATQWSRRDDWIAAGVVA